MKMMKWTATTLAFFMLFTVAGAVSAQPKVKNQPSAPVEERAKHDISKSSIQNIRGRSAAPVPPDESTNLNSSRSNVNRQAAPVVPAPDESVNLNSGRTNRTAPPVLPQPDETVACCTKSSKSNSSEREAAPGVPPVVPPPDESTNLKSSKSGRGATNLNSSRSNVTREAAPGVPPVAPVAPEKGKTPKIKSTKSNTSE